MVLTEYMERLDGADPGAALEVMEPDIEFVMVVPAGTIRGFGHDDYSDYIARRNAGDRVHDVRAQAVDGNYEFVSGVVREAGLVLGTFLSTAVVSPAGKMSRYLVVFDTETDLEA